MRVGAGVYYSDFNTYITAKSSNVGGFLTASLWHYWERGASLQLDISAGFGTSSIVDSNGVRKQFNQFVLLNPSVGYNLSKNKDNPLIISLSFPADMHVMGRLIGRGVRSGQHFEQTWNFMGVSAFQRVMINDSFGVEYSLGYAFNMFKRYGGVSFDERFWFEGGSRFEGSLGVIYRRDTQSLVELPIERAKGADFYARFKGVYYNMNEFSATYGSVNILYPKTNNFLLLFELGVSIDWLYW